MSAATIEQARGAMARVERWEAGEGMAERGRGSRKRGTGQGEQRSLALAPAAARMRTRDWGERRVERFRRLGQWVYDARRRAGDTLEGVSAAAAADGMPMHYRQVWNLEQMRNERVAAARKDFSFPTVAYLAQRWGWTLDQLWAYMTSGEEPAPSVAQAERTEADALGDVFVSLRSSPATADLADELVSFVRYLLTKAEARGAPSATDNPSRGTIEGDAH